MTTSFAMWVRGDITNSLKANCIGTMLATYCGLVLVWCLISAVRGRFFLIRSVEGPVGISVAALTVFMLLRWGIVMAYR